MNEYSDKGQRKTGIVWSYRRETEQMFHGNFASRHEAIGHAAIIGRIADEETDIRWKESLWRDKDTPTVCGYCGYETHYLPLMGWVFSRSDESPFCTEECAARHQYESQETA